MKNILVTLTLLLFSTSLTANTLSGSFKSPDVSSNNTSRMAAPEPLVCNPNNQKLHWNGNAWQCLASIPNPPSCNAATQKLHWTGSKWECTSNAYAKGSVYSSGGTGVGGAITCPSGTSPVITHSEISGFNIARRSYLCIVN